MPQTNTKTGSLGLSLIWGFGLALLYLLMICFFLAFFESLGWVTPINFGRYPLFIHIMIVLAAAFLTTKKTGERGLVTGLLISLFYSLFALTFFCWQGNSLIACPSFIISIIAILLAGILAGILGVNFYKV